MKSQRKFSVVVLSLILAGWVSVTFAASDTINSNPANVKRLGAYGQLWGFLKYHHPAVASGKFDFDQQFLRNLPLVISVGSDQEFSSVMEKWLDELGKIEPCKRCEVNFKGEVTLLPDYGDLFSSPVFSISLAQRLKFIRDNAISKSNYYISLKAGPNNPSFDHENAYSGNPYPSAGLRLLGLMRYWNIIQYFSPNRELVSKPWGEILHEFIPQMIAVQNAKEYSYEVARLISATKDTHAFIGSRVFSATLGKNITPFKAEFLGDDLVVASNYSDSSSIPALAQPGDLILAINAVQTADMVKKSLPVVSASNMAAAKRDLPIYHLVRSDSAVMNLGIERNGKKLDIIQPLIPYHVRFHTERFTGKIGEQAYDVMSDKYMYIRSSGFREEDYKKLRQQIQVLKGIIVDLRCYPSGNLIRTLVSDLKSKSTAFVKLSHPVIARPGLFLSEVNYVGGTGKIGEDMPVVVLVNEITQSHAEYVAMAFGQVKNATIIGSQTSGADGNVSVLNFPGGIYTNLSGLGVYYPDGKTAQGEGVRIDVEVLPTIEGIRAGRDEILAKALEILEEKNNRSLH